MGKFENYFGEPHLFTGGIYVIGGWLSRIEAAQAINDDYDTEIEPEQLERDRIRYGFAPSDVEDHDEISPCWYTGASGKGSKEVWIFNR